MEFTEYLALFELLFVSADCVGDISGVPFDDIHFRQFFGLVMLLQLLFHLFFGELIEPDDFFHKLLVVEFVAEGLVVGEGRVDPEDNREFFLHGGPEGVKVILR